MPDQQNNAEFMTERDAAREKLRQSIDALADRTNLQVQMQKEPLKMLGGASAVGAVIGLIAGRQLRRSKKIYVDASSPEKHQRALMKAQSQQQNGRSIGGALIATLGTLAVKTLTERVITPKLEELSGNLLDRAGQAPRTPAVASKASVPSAPVSITPSKLPQLQEERAATPTQPTPAQQSQVQPIQTQLSQTQPSQAAYVPPKVTATSASAPSTLGSHLGVRPMPESHVEAKAKGSDISPAELGNPNQR